jgi:hypothetical protein
MSLILKLRCESHPRYDPVRHGEAGIRGACQKCYNLLRVYRTYLQLRSEEETDETQPHYNS